jgi:hypothetical protein
MFPLVLPLSVRGIASERMGWCEEILCWWSGSASGFSSCFTGSSQCLKIRRVEKNRSRPIPIFSPNVGLTVPIFLTAPIFEKSATGEFLQIRPIF